MIKILFYIFDKSVLLTGMEEFCSDGSEFHVAFFSNLILPPIFSQASISVQITNTDNVFEQTIAISYKGDSRELTLAPHATDTVNVPIHLRFGAVGEQDKGVFIQSMDRAKLVVTAFGGEFSSSDTYRVVPVVFLPSTYEYYAMCARKDSRIIDDEGVLVPVSPTSNSVIVFIASENNTKVTITPSRDVHITQNITTLAGSTIEKTLTEKEAVFISSVEDLTGTYVASNKPLAFFSGHECGNMPSDRIFCDHMVEQILPTATWGIEFYSSSFMTRPKDVFRVLSSSDGNSITWICVGDTIITNETDIPTAGVAVEFEITANVFCRFATSSPVLLAQFSIGGGGAFIADPSMTIIPPVGQYRSHHILNYFAGSSHNTNFVNIIVFNTPVVSTSGVMLNGHPINNPWTEIRCEVRSIDVCAYGVQLQVEDVSDGAVILSHTNSEAKLMGITYSTDIRTSSATFSGMSQKPIACKSVILHVHMHA